jgi:cadmium resistance protein CadD (predicted permease)
MLEVVLTAITAFISTNIDDLFILILLFSQTAVSWKRYAIFAGQYLGICTLIVLSLAGSMIKFVVSPTYLGFLGLLPVTIGVIGLYRVLTGTTEGEEEPPVTQTIGSRNRMASFGLHSLSVASVTIANGADNIGIYVPLFAILTNRELVITIVIFLGLVYVWLQSAAYLARHPVVQKTISPYRHFIFPFLLIGLGVYILIESGAINVVTALVYNGR